MKLPVWSFELLRDTNAPFERVVATLMDGGNYGAWHPRHAQVSPRLVVNDVDRVEVEHRDEPVLGVKEWSRYIVQRSGDRVILRHVGHFRGLLVLLFMAYWRIKSGQLWERFVSSLN